MTDNVPPVNIEIEEAILGGILLDPKAYERVKSTITTAMFSLQAHRIIYKAMTALNEKNKPTDLMGVSTFLADRELLETVGGTTKLGQLLNRTVSAVGIERYAEILIDKWKRRELIKLGHELIDLGYENAIDLPDLINRVKSELDSWIGSDENPENLIGRMSYTATAHQHGEHYAETIKLEAEIDLNSDPTAQIKKLQKQAKALLESTPSE